MLKVSVSLIIAISVQLLCQLFKVVLYSIKDGKLSFHYFFTPGGMPSAHSAFVTSLTTSVAVNSGIDSEVFAVSVVFSAIIIYDALRLRGTVERHSKALNIIYRKFLPNEEANFSEMVGHSLDEIVAGIAVGIALPLLFLYLFPIFPR